MNAFIFMYCACMLGLEAYLLGAEQRECAGMGVVVVVVVCHYHQSIEEACRAASGES